MIINRDITIKEGKIVGMNQIKAAFFDIDGTLVSFKTHAVAESVKAVIKKLREGGVKVFVCTGRMLKMVSVLDDIEFDGYISYNGALCVDSSKEGVIFKHTIPQNYLDELAKRLEWDKFPISFMCRNEMYVNYITPMVAKVSEIVSVSLPIEKEAKEIIKEDIYQLCIYENNAKVQSIIDETMPICEQSRWIEYFADVNIKGVNKQLGIDKMLEHFKIPLGSAMAFGDGGNDIPMLKHAPYSVAMGNAPDDVKSTAAFVTTSVDEDGIINALKFFKSKGVLPIDI